MIDIEKITKNKLTLEKAEEMMNVLFDKALKGNLKAIELVLKLVRQYPVNEINISTTSDLASEFYKYIQNR